MGLQLFCPCARLSLRGFICIAVCWSSSVSSVLTLSTRRNKKQIISLMRLHTQQPWKNEQANSVIGLFSSVMLSCRADSSSDVVDLQIVRVIEDKTNCASGSLYLAYLLWPEQQLCLCWTLIRKFMVIYTRPTVFCDFLRMLAVGSDAQPEEECTAWSCTIQTTAGSYATESLSRW